MIEISLRQKQAWAQRLAYGAIGTTLITATLATVAYWQTRGLLYQNAVSRLHVAVDLKEQLIQRWLEQQQDDVQVVASLSTLQEQIPILVAAAEADSRVEEEAFRAEISSDEGRLSEHASGGADVDGGQDTDERQDTDNRGLGSAIADVSFYFDRIAILKPALRRLEIISPSGLLLFSSDPSSPSSSPSFRTASQTFFTPVTAREVVPNFYWSQSSATPALTFATPVYSRRQQLIGTISIDIDLTPLDEIMAGNQGLWPSTETYLVTRRGQSYGFVAHDLDIRRQLGLPVTTTQPTALNSRAIDETINRGNSDQGQYTNYSGIPVVGVYRWLPKQELALIAEVPEEDVFALAWRTAALIAEVGFTAAGAMLGGAFMIARSKGRQEELPIEHR